MPRLIYHDELTVEVDTNTSILRTSLEHGLPHTHACGGNARCSTCRVLILDGLEYCCPRNEKEQGMAERLNLVPVVRLACQTTINGDVTVRRLVLDDEDRELVDQEFADKTAGVGEERQLAILFADIRGFTTFSERHPAYDVVHVLNRYFSRVCAVINYYDGQIDNFIGDGIMALFGLDAAEDAAFRAVRTGLGMLAEVQAMQPYFRRHFKLDFRIGVGVHVGSVVLGTIGAGERRRLTAIGDAVNFASRIEGLNKETGTQFLISDDAYLEVQDAVLVGGTFEMPIKGKTGSYILYEVLGMRG